MLKESNRKAIALKDKEIAAKDKELLSIQSKLTARGIVEHFASYLHDALGKKSSNYTHAYADAAAAAYGVGPLRNDIQLLKTMYCTVRAL